jgi:hypothetical protein
MWPHREEGEKGMRALALLPLLLVASCGDGAAENKAAATAAADTPAAGQWALTSQVTRFHKADQGTARIDTPVGSSATQNLCVAPGARLPTLLFSGDDFTCSYSSYYVRGGHANVSLNCHREGLTGDILMTVDGTFDAHSVNLHRSLRTILSGDGDVELDATVTGHQTGACTPAPATEGRNSQ